MPLGPTPRRDRGGRVRRKEGKGRTKKRHRVSPVLGTLVRIGRPKLPYVRVQVMDYDGHGKLLQCKQLSLYDRTFTDVLDVLKWAAPVVFADSSARHD